MQDLPPGWNEERIQKVIEHYDNQTEDEAVEEDLCSAPVFHLSRDAGREQPGRRESRRGGGVPHLSLLSPSPWRTASGGDPVDTLAGGQEFPALPGQGKLSAGGRGLYGGPSQGPSPVTQGAQRARDGHADHVDPFSNALQE